MNVAYARSAYEVVAALDVPSDNNLPAFGGQVPDAFNVQEDAAVGSVVGTVRAFDDDSNDILSHIIGRDARFFVRY